MRVTFRLIALFWLLSGCVGISWGQINEDFSDGELSTNPLWQGDVANFIVNPEFQLQLDAEPISDTSILVTNIPLNTGAQIVWEFWMQLDFDPSNNNNMRFYLMSDQANLKAPLNGYFLRIGENGAEDRIRLFRQQGQASSATEILSGSANIFPSSPVGRIRVVREANGIWSISSDDTGGSSFVPEGSVEDLQITNTVYTGFFLKYSSGNSSAFRFDDIIIQGQEVVDLDPPLLNSVEVLDANTLELQFSEALDPASAEDPGNYLVPGLGNPASATLDADPSVVLVDFSSDFPANQNLEISVSGIADLNGNILSSASEDFVYVVASVAGPRDVLFNEIFADPTPSFGLPEAEYLELYNPTEEFFNLAGWTFVNTTTEKVLPEYNLGPGEFVILCNSSAADLFNGFGPVIPISSFTALANSGDSLTLRNQNDVVIDIVVYSLDWYQDPEKEEGGWSLEQINPNSQCSGSNNWTGSTFPLGGTPGEANSVFDDSPDLNPPLLLSVSSPNAQTLVFQFNEALNENTDYTNNLAVSGGISVVGFSLSPDLEVLTFSVNPGFELGNSYTYLLSDITDCPGNVSEPFEGEITSGFEPGPGDIQINEIFADPSPVVGLPEAEFVEFFNASNQLIDMSNCDFSGASFPVGTLIAPGEYLVALSEANQQQIPFYNEATPMSSWSSTFLTNSGRDLILTNADGVVVDQVSYNLTWYQDPSKTDGGWSIERINPNDPCSDRSNWRASISESGGTPGSQNSIYNDTPDITPVTLNSIFVPNGQSIQLNFSEPIDEASAFGAQYVISGGLSVVGINPFGTPTTGLLLDLELPMTPGIVYSFSLTGIEDCWGNGADLTLTGEFAEPEFAAPGDLIINEVLSNPYDDGVDYVEIYNRSMKNISLNGWKLASESDGMPNQQNVITSFDYLLFPGEYALLTTSIEGVANFYPNAKVDRFVLMPGFPTYSNAEGVVYLLDPLEQVSDRFAYDEDLHFPLLDDLDGVSLERLDFSRPSSDRGNWLSAAEAEGYGTPGYENSQLAVAGLSSSTLSVEPEVFSPDNDGFQDVALISYKFDTPGYTGNFSVFDDRGRLVKKLANNDLLGTSGTYTWNGFDDQERKAEIGIYVIVAEVFSPNGETELLKTPCVLAHRLN